MSKKRSKALLNKEIAFSVSISQEPKERTIPEVPDKYKELLITEMKRLEVEKQEDEAEDAKPKAVQIPKPQVLPPIQDGIEVRLSDGRVISLFEAVQTGISLTLRQSEAK